MKKKIKIIVIVALILIILVPYIFVEGNTLLFGSEFKNQYKQTNMIDDIEYYKVFNKLDIENPIIRINTAFKGCSSLEKISVLPRIYHN
ncbi:MAG: hypothetical protein ACLRR3_09495 [Eubacterium sp.]